MKETFLITMKFEINDFKMNEGCSPDDEEIKKYRLLHEEAKEAHEESLQNYREFKKQLIGYLSILPVVLSLLSFSFSSLLNFKSTFYTIISTTFVITLVFLVYSFLKFFSLLRSNKLLSKLDNVSAYEEYSCLSERDLYIQLIDHHLESSNNNKKITQELFYKFNKLFELSGFSIIIVLVQIILINIF